MKTNKKLIGIALVVTAIIFAGTASTAALTIGSNVGTLGYKAQTVLGGTVVSIKYGLGNGADPSTIDTVTVEIKDPNLDVGALGVVPVATIILTDGTTPGAFLICTPGVQSATGTAAVLDASGIITTAASADATFNSVCTTVSATTNAGVINALTLTGINVTVQNN